MNASEPGLHTVEVEWDGQPIPGSPFLVRIMQAPDMNKVRAYGPGLESGVIGILFYQLFSIKPQLVSILYFFRQCCIPYWPKQCRNKIFFTHNYFRHFCTKERKF